MNAKHTPGPWKADWVDDKRFYGYRIGPEGKDGFVCTVSGKFGKPDAHLIAAAPQMLEALEIIRQRAIDYPKNEMAQVNAETARAAIAKAVQD